MWSPVTPQEWAASLLMQATLSFLYPSHQINDHFREKNPNQPLPKQDIGKHIVRSKHILARAKTPKEAWLCESMPYSATAPIFPWKAEISYPLQLRYPAIHQLQHLLALLSPHALQIPLCTIAGSRPSMHQPVAGSFRCERGGTRVHGAVHTHRHWCQTGRLALGGGTTLSFSSLPNCTWFARTCFNFLSSLPEAVEIASGLKIYWRRGGLREWWEDKECHCIILISLGYKVKAV